MKKHFYVYFLLHSETKEFYFGSRGCTCLPDGDVKYMGSMTRWKPDKDKLVKTILGEFVTRDEAYDAESEIIERHIKNDLCMNAYIPRKGFCMDGLHHSDKTKNKLRESSRGNKNMLNKKHSTETKKLISDKLKGRTLSEETKKKMSISGKRRKPISEETRKKISDGNRGKKQSAEARYKMRMRKLGVKQSAETISNRVKKNNKRIAHISDNGDVIKEYNSQIICANELKINSSTVSQILHGRKHPRFKFEYILG